MKGYLHTLLTLIIIFGCSHVYAAEENQAWLDSQMTDFQPTQRKVVLRFFDDLESSQEEQKETLRKSAPSNLRESLEKVLHDYELTSPEVERSVMQRFLKLRDSGLYHDRNTYSKEIWKKRVRDLSDKAAKVAKIEEQLKIEIQQLNKKNLETTDYRSNASIEHIKMLAADLQEASVELAAMSLAAQYFQVTEVATTSGEYEQFIKKQKFKRNILLPILISATIASCSYAIFDSVENAGYAVSGAALLMFLVKVTRDAFLYKKNDNQTYNEFSDNYPLLYSRPIITKALNSILADMSAKQGVQTTEAVLEKLRPTLKRLGCNRKVKVRIDTREFEEAPKEKIRIPLDESKSKLRVSPVHEESVEELEEIAPVQGPKRMTLPESR